MLNGFVYSSIIGLNVGDVDGSVLPSAIYFAISGDNEFVAWSLVKRYFQVILCWCDEICERPQICSYAAYGCGKEQCIKLDVYLGDIEGEYKLIFEFLEPVIIDVQLLFESGEDQDVVVLIIVKGLDFGLGSDFEEDGGGEVGVAEDVFSEVEEDSFEDPLDFEDGVGEGVLVDEVEGVGVVDEEVVVGGECECVGGVLEDVAVLEGDCVVELQLVEHEDEDPDGVGEGHCDQVAVGVDVEVLGGGLQLEGLLQRVGVPPLQLPVAGQGEHHPARVAAGHGHYGRPVHVQYLLRLAVGVELDLDQLQADGALLPGLLLDVHVPLLPALLQDLDLVVLLAPVLRLDQLVVLLRPLRRGHALGVVHIQRDGPDEVGHGQLQPARQVELLVEGVDLVHVDRVQQLVPDEEALLPVRGDAAPVEHPLHRDVEPLQHRQVLHKQQLPLRSDHSHVGHLQGSAHSLRGVLSQQGDALPQPELQDAVPDQHVALVLRLSEPHDLAVPARQLELLEAQRVLHPHAPHRQRYARLVRRHRQQLLPLKELARLYHVVLVVPQVRVHVRIRQRVLRLVDLHLRRQLLVFVLQHEAELILIVEEVRGLFILNVLHDDLLIVDCYVFTTQVGDIVLLVIQSIFEYGCLIEPDSFADLNHRPGDELLR